MMKNAKITTAIILSLVILLYLIILEANKYKNNISVIIMVVPEKSVPPKLNILKSPILDKGSLITQVNPATATIIIRILSTNVNGFNLSSIFV